MTSIAVRSETGVLEPPLNRLIRDTGTTGGICLDVAVAVNICADAVACARHRACCTGLCSPVSPTGNLGIRIVERPVGISINVQAKGRIMTKRAGVLMSGRDVPIPGTVPDM